jgi:hypothetical protein
MPALSKRLGLRPPSYQGPTGVAGVLQETLGRAGVPSVSLRVPVPYYVATPPNPLGTRTLLARLEQVLGIPTEHAELDTDVAEWRRQVDDAVATDLDIAQQVRMLEQRSDRLTESSADASELITELEAFLREQRDENTEGDGNDESDENGSDGGD